MARLTEQQWELARADYEVRGVSIRQIAKEYDVAPSTISRRANKDGWVEGKTQHLVERKVNAVRELQDTQQQMQHLNATQIAVIDNEVERRLRLEKRFTESALRNQELADQMLNSCVEMKELKSHADLTAKNKETILGKQPDTAIQINNNSGSVIDELVAKRVTG